MTIKQHTANTTILVIGSGGREHALAWKLSLSPQVTKVYVAPGNVGTAQEPKIENIALNDTQELISFARQNHISFTVVGPEVPLADGIVDKFRQHNLKIWGPTQFCTQLESSKTFAKQFMQKYNIPTANYQTFTDHIEAKAYLKQQSLPIVIKADGLAAGKGVLVATNLEQGLNFIDEIFLNNKFGNAGNKVVIEEFLAGTEASFIVMIDGKNILPMATSQDHKRLLNNDEGPNTGGMGVYSPAPIIDHKLHERVLREIIQPVINGMHAEGHEYSGFLYAGLMIDSNGNPKTLEFNCRFGDPETQAIMLRLDSDFAELISLGLGQKLDQIQAKWNEGFSVGVVLASAGYPDSPQKNDLITGIDAVAKLTDVKVFHAATKLDGTQLKTAGGRVVCVVGLDKDIHLAQQKAYTAIKKIHFRGMQYRTDIGNKAYPDRTECARLINL